MRKITQDEFNDILDKHEKWLAGIPGGERAVFKNIDMSNLDMRWCDIRGCNIRGCDMHGCDMRWCVMCGCDIDDETMRISFPLLCPEKGAFIGWKKCVRREERLIVKLQITDDAKRSSAFGRKCRCSKAIVLEIQNLDGTKSDYSWAVSGYDSMFIYTVGKTVEVENFDEDRKNECSAGIHFFVTRQEAVEYGRL